MTSEMRIGARAGRLLLPYNLHRCGGKGDVFLFLNRDYQPVGTFGFDGYTHDDHPSRLRIKGLTVARAEAAGLVDGYFFKDGCTPWGSAEGWQRYQKILGRLMAYKCEPVAAIVSPGLDYLHKRARA